MAFNVAYYDLLDKNIRHIYSSLPSNARFRCEPVPGVTLHAHDGCLSSHTKKGPPPQTRVPQRLHRRLWAYSAEYGSQMPKAPAFRCLSTAEVQDITNRVSRMTRTHKRRRVSYWDQYDDERYSDCPPTDSYSCQHDASRTMTPSSSRCSRSPTPASSVARGAWGWGSGGGGGGKDTPGADSHPHPHPRSRTPAEQDAATRRLLRPTTSFSIRSDLKVGSSMNPVEVVALRSSRSRSSARSGKSARSDRSSSASGGDGSC